MAVDSIWPLLLKKFFWTASHTTPPFFRSELVGGSTAAFAQSTVNSPFPVSAVDIASRTSPWATNANALKYPIAYPRRDECLISRREQIDSASNERKSTSDQRSHDRSDDIKEQTFVASQQWETITTHSVKQPSNVEHSAINLLLLVIPAYIVGCLSIAFFVYCLLATLIERNSVRTNQSLEIYLL